MNILLIVVDTLRASRLGCYGYGLPTSPAMDRLAEQGVRYARCIAPGIPTTPAHTTLYTGLHPLTHNIVCHGGQVDLDRKIPVFPELLQAAGYTTVAVDNLYDIKPWLARGYEFYINPSFRHKLRLLVSCDEINARAIPWLKDHGHERFFMFVHYWEPHTPYMPPERYHWFYPADRDPYSAHHHSMEPVRRTPIWGMFHDLWFDKLGPVTDADYISALYDAEIRHVDDGIAELLAALDELGLAENTLVVLTGDHGESLTEHDIYFDHHGLYDETIHVPLLLRHPGQIAAGTKLNGMVQHLDIAPTLLEAAGARIPAAMEGKSFWPAATAKTPHAGWPSILCCESTWQSKYALRTDTQKLILSRHADRHGMPMLELYDLKHDPAELTNLASEQPENVANLANELETGIWDRLKKAGRTEDPLLSQGITLGKRWDAWTRP
jgi:arylsulfatase A-like enzyme